MTSIEELNPELKGIGRYQFGWADRDDAGAEAKRGLNEDVVRDISGKKHQRRDCGDGGGDANATRPKQLHSNVGRQGPDGRSGSPIGFSNYRLPSCAETNLLIKACTSAAVGSGIPS